MQRELSEFEQQQLFKLLTYKTLLSTHVSDWKKSPDEFISLAIPEELKKFTKTFTNNQEVLEGIIRDLIMRGITSIALETKSPENVELMIYNVLNPGEKEH